MSNSIGKKKMKLSLKQRFKNWLLNDDDDDIYVPQAVIETPSLDSEGMRFTVFKASGGFVIETRTYDRRKDESNNSIYVITENQDLGQELGKIITMESLR
jgi:hypothetical protein